MRLSLRLWCDVWADEASQGVACKSSLYIAVQKAYFVTFNRSLTFLGRMLSSCTTTRACH